MAVRAVDKIGPNGQRQVLGACGKVRDLAQRGFPDRDGGLVHDYETFSIDTLRRETESGRTDASEAFGCSGKMEDIQGREVAKNLEGERVSQMVMRKDAQIGAGNARHTSNKTSSGSDGSKDNLAWSRSGRATHTRDIQRDLP